MWHTLKKENRYRVSAGKTEENRLLGIPTSRREYNIKKKFKKIVLDDVTWINLS